MPRKKPTLKVPDDRDARVRGELLLLQHEFAQLFGDLLAAVVTVHGVDKP
jgi:hypothetical protein